MEERRTIIRCECLERAEYRSAADPVPRDGRLTTLTERGLSLLANEPHQVGEHLTVSFTLPGEEEALTTAGVVRWARETTAKKGWYLLGLEWLPLEETTRFRLDTFLRHQSEAQRQDSLTGSKSSWRKRWQRRIVRWSTAALVSLGVAVALLVCVLWLQQANMQLGDTVHRRNLAIARLEDSEERFRQEFEVATTQLADASNELEQLGQQSGQFQEERQRLTQEVERIQTAYATLREDREQLIRRIFDLEQERAQMLQQLPSSPLLRRTIQDDPDASDPDTEGVGVGFPAQSAQDPHE